MSATGHLTHEMIHNTDEFGYAARIMQGTATRGTIRMEWHHALTTQAFPANWAVIGSTIPMSTLIPVRFQVPDAQNLIVKAAIEAKVEWLFLLEDDVLVPPKTFVRLNEWMRRHDTPVISGLYYQKSEPVEPLVYRGRGWGAHSDFTVGDLVWADGVPTGVLLVHCSLLKAMWDESEPYEVSGQRTRRVFSVEPQAWTRPDGSISVQSGTSDLAWCKRIMDEKFFDKAGWPEYQARQYPFLVDTRISCGHITPDGQIYPPDWKPEAR